MSDDYDLERFTKAQGDMVYEAALGELRKGSKAGHWMWFVFPQLAGLGRSQTARYYAISDLSEARAYLAHETLGKRLIECTSAMLGWVCERTAEQVLGTIDALKLRSSMTLFEAASDEPELFAQSLEGFYAGERDAATLERL